MSNDEKQAGNALNPYFQKEIFHGKSEIRIQGQNWKSDPGGANNRYCNKNIGIISAWSALVEIRPYEELIQIPMNLKK